jgi:hypothetical protein
MFVRIIRNPRKKHIRKGLKPQAARRPIPPRPRSSICRSRFRYPGSTQTTWIRKSTHSSQQIHPPIVISRNIGVRFTATAWNLTTHRIDPDIDVSRDYVLEDLLDAERVEAAGYADANSPSTSSSPRRNLTGDPYYTDGRRVIIN